MDAERVGQTLLAETASPAQLAEVLAQLALQVSLHGDTLTGRYCSVYRLISSITVMNRWDRALLAVAAVLMAAAGAVLALR